MNTKTFLSASRLLVMALLLSISFCFAACDGYDETSVDELLSDKTTPIDFELQDFETYDKYYLFDYAGNIFVGADTISKSKCTINLRQGKHHLIWMKGQYGVEVGFVPESRTFSGSNPYIDAKYSEMDIEVTPYLMPVQSVKCQEQITIGGGDLYIKVTDMRGNMETPRGVKVSEKVRVTGFPFVDNISLDGKNYENRKDIRTEWVYFDDRGETVGIVLHTLFLTDRIENFHVAVEVEDTNGKHISTTALPSASIQRDCATTLRGPLFSGSTADWSVTMESYK